MTNTDNEFKWLNNIRSSIYSLTVAGGLLEYYDRWNMNMPSFGHDEGRMKNAFHKFSPRGIEALKPFVPYALNPVWEWNLDADGEPLGEAFYKSHIWVNRFYKPLGCPTRNFYKYEDYKDLHIKSKSKELEEMASLFIIEDGHEVNPVYWCHRQLETKKQVKELIEKLLKVVSICRATPAPATI